MADTIFQRIDSQLQGNGLAAAIAAATSKLSGAEAQFTALSQGKLPSIDSLTSALGGMALPNINVTAGLSGSLTAIAGAIPSDLSSLTGGLTTALGGLDANVTTSIGGQMEKIVAAIGALQQLATQGFAPFDGTASGAASASASPQAQAAPAAGATHAQHVAAAAPPPAPASAPAASDPAAAARQRRSEAVHTASQALAALPPFTGQTLLDFLGNLFSQVPRELAPIRKIPLIDDVLQIFATVVALRQKDAAGLKTYIQDTTQHLATFLTANGEKAILAYTGQIATLTAAVDLTALKNDAATLATTLARIGSAVSNGDLSGVDPDVTAANAALDTLLPRIAAMNTHLFSGQVDAASRAFERLPIDIERQMRRVVQGVKPPDQTAMFQGWGDRITAELQFAPPDTLPTQVDQLLNPLIHALDIINITPIREPLLTAIDGIKSASDGIDHLIAEAASQSALLFDQVNQLLAQIDVTGIVNQITQAITDFQNTLQQQVATLFAPIQSAISTAVGALRDAVSGFNPDDLVNALKDVIDKLSGVLDSPDVKGAIDAIKQAIQTAADQIGKISFTPVTGEVIASIDDVTNALKAIDPATLSIEVKGALTAAVAILPGDLKPVTDPLVADFGKLVSTGPQPILVQVQAQPANLLAQIQNFSPGKLIGDQLSGPVQALVGQLVQFKPSSLLQPVEQALTSLKDQVRQKADPGQLLQPLEDIFNKLLAQFDKLKPEDLVKPPNDIVQGVINKVLNALPVDDVLHAFDDILARVKSVFDMAGDVKSMLGGFAALFQGLGDPETQIRAWLQPIFDHLNQISDVAGLQPSFDQVGVAVNQLKADSLRATLSAALDPLKNGLNSLQPKAALDTLSAAYGSIQPGALAALPASARKTAIQTLIGRFNPVAADFARPFEGLDTWQSEILHDQPAFDALLVHWDLRFHGTSGPFAGFLHPNITVDQLRTVFHDALEQEVVQPLSHMLGIFHSVSLGAKPAFDRVEAAIDAFDNKIQDVLLGPTALGGIRDALHSLVDRLRNINFQFLVTQLNTVFQSVRGKLQAVSPTAIRTIVSTAFNNALNLLDIHQLLPADQIGALDQTYQTIIDGLKKFDPKKLIIDVVQPEFDTKIVPLLQSFDITAVIKAIIDRLDGLKAELQTELDKTNQHYQAMLAAVPKISLSDLAGAAAGAIGDVAGAIGGSIGF